LVRTLEEEGAESGVPVNAVVASVLDHYFRWTSKTHDLGLVSIHKPVFVKMIEELDDETLAHLGREDLASSWKDMAKFWFGDSSAESMLKFLSSRAKCEVEERPRATRGMNEYTILIHHDFGPKWSIVLRGALQEVIKSSFHSESHVSAGASVVTGRFRTSEGHSSSQTPPHEIIHHSSD